MSKIMDPILAHLADVKRDREQSYAESFESKIVKKVIAELGSLNPDNSTNLYDFVKAQQFPFKLRASKTKLLMNRYVKNPIKTKVWDEFMDLVDDCADTKRCALIVRSVGYGLKVIHNDWGLPFVPGNLRLMWPAISEGKGVCLESLPAFLRAVKTIWS